MAKVRNQRRRGFTRLSGKNQITIPVDALRRAGLKPGDELRVGGTRLVYRSDHPPGGGTGTQASEPPPELTRREREVLVVLCRTVLAGEAFTEPASIREIADALVVSEAAVKQHLGHLYDKFGIHGGGERRRVRLAN